MTPEDSRALTKKIYRPHDPTRISSDKNLVGYNPEYTQHPPSGQNCGSTFRQASAVDDNREGRFSKGSKYCTRTRDFKVAYRAVIHCEPAVSSEGCECLFSLDTSAREYYGTKSALDGFFCSFMCRFYVSLRRSYLATVGEIVTRGECET
jgi:hypothetical protein